MCDPCHRHSVSTSGSELPCSSVVIKRMQVVRVGLLCVAWASTNRCPCRGSDGVCSRMRKHQRRLLFVLMASSCACILSYQIQQTRRASLPPEDVKTLWGERAHVLGGGANRGRNDLCLRGCLGENARGCFATQVDGYGVVCRSERSHLAAGPHRVCRSLAQHRFARHAIAVGRAKLVGGLRVCLSKESHLHPAIPVAEKQAMDRLQAQRVHVVPLH